MEEILNAKITSVSLSMADHGCLTFYITSLEEDGEFQSEAMLSDTDI